MPFIRFDDIITKVYDILRQDARTLAIDWHNGRRAEVQQSPAGNVYLGSGTIIPFTMPTGEEASFRVMIELLYAKHEGAPEAEQALRVGMDAVAQVLVDNWNLGLSYAYPIALGWEPTINPETLPPMARARMSLDVKVIPGD